MDTDALKDQFIFKINRDDVESLVNGFNSVIQSPNRKATFRDHLCRFSPCQGQISSSPSNNTDLPGQLNDTDLSGQVKDTALLDQVNGRSPPAQIRTQLYQANSRAHIYQAK